MTSWPSGWQNATLRTAGITPTRFAKDVLSLWQASTPLDPWTHNPIGMPMKGNSPRAVPNTSYAVFSSMSDFRKVFAGFLSSQRGAGTLNVLTNGQSLSDAWREIHALKWPADATESDYPANILDKLADEYAVKLRKRSAGKNKSSGTIQPQPQLHQQVVAGHQTMVRAMQQHTDSSAMIRQILRETK